MAAFFKMVAKESILILFAFIALTSSSVIQPFDLAEEAEKQLQQLITIVRRRILLADDDIQDLYNDFRQYSRDEIYDGQIAIRQEYETVNLQISQIKGLAQSAGKDVSSCTNILEDTLQESSVTYNDQITACVNNVLVEGLRVTRDAKYFVDIIMNKVHNIENQLKSCGGDLLCISPLLTQIELYQVSLIQDIRMEVSAVDQLLATLKLSSKTCADQGVSSYVSEANVILREITNCANAILG